MSLKTQTTCDNCGEDMTYTGNVTDYYIELRSVSKQPWYIKEGLSGGAMTCMNIEPKFSRSAHFCGLNCLKQWINKDNTDASK